jgi:hypothetical protein
LTKVIAASALMFHICAVHPLLPILPALLALCTLGELQHSRAEESARRATEPVPGSLLEAKTDASGAIVILDASKPVLRYNYQAVQPGDVLSQVHPDNLKYARARSDYIHPLYGPAGEELTKDWSVDHPHHRGIYWAWPEVQYNGELGDLHALQRVFARPTGSVTLQTGPRSAQIDAENLWVWDNGDEIVRERVFIRALTLTRAGRCIDLELHFTALRDGVTVARRGTEHYGGLNLRMAAVRQQQITVWTSPAGAQPRRAWADLSGLFGAGPEQAGLTILQHAGNPEFPGDWIQYPDLNWVQPTFPSAKTRFALKKNQALVLRFRLWVHSGGKPADAVIMRQWNAFAQ